MKKPILAFLLIVVSLVGCNAPDSNLQKRATATWQEKKLEILDSLSLCFSTQDSIICLNRFAHRDALHGGNTVQCERFDTYKNLDNWPAYKWYEYLLKDSISVFCGCNTNLANSLYREFMSTTVIPHGFSIGKPNSDDGHYISLLVVRGENNNNMYLTDAMFNSAYVLQDGKLADVRYLLYLTRKNRTDQFKILAYHDNASYLLTDTQNVSFTNPTYDLRLPHHFTKSRNTSYPYVLSCPRTLDHYLESQFSNTYVKIASYYGIDTLQFKTEKDFRMCVLFFRSVYGPYADIIERELEFYNTIPLDTLDQIFDKYDMRI